MRKMKDSGISWIGQIPQEWNVSKLKYSVICRDSERIPVDKNLRIDGPYPYWGAGSIMDYVNDYIFDDDLVLLGEDGAPFFEWRRDVAHHIKGKCWINNHIHVLQAKSGVVNNSFLTHFLNIVDYKSYINGAILNKLTQGNMMEIALCLPSLQEQDTIITFLDSKCAEIDALSADIQSEIETLEAYKRSVITEAVTKGLDKSAPIIKSRVFYMAPYNAEWHLSKIGYECTKLTRAFQAEDIPLLCTNKGKIAVRPEEMSGKMVSEDNAMQGIHKGDIAIHGMDTWHGAIALSEYSGKITRVVHVCDSKHDKRFIVYYLQQLAFNGVYKLISNGVRGNTSDFRSWDKVSDIYIALPERDVQEQIADYLDAMCVAVESIIAQRQEQLAVLADYKKSIIYEYVTGKKEVPVA